ncbi:MAG: hypothetical protein IPM98_13590 [Lewinellaceae bacterium]|nr:hypothetical protein [Lewinellaceae bacterium]
MQTDKTVIAATFIWLLLGFPISVRGQVLQLLKDIRRPISQTIPQIGTYCVNIKGKIYFDGHSQSNTSGLWEYDGKTARLVDTHLGIRFALDADDGFFLFDNDPTSSTHCLLWKTDGTPCSFLELARVEVGTYYAPVHATVIKNRIIYANTTSEHGRELWISGSSPDQTQMLVDIRPGIQSSNPTDFATVDSIAFFHAQDTSGNYRLWRTDGTTTGTYAISPPYSVIPSISDSRFMRTVGNYVYYVIPKSEYHNELWKSDGSITGTFKVADVPGTPWSTYPGALSLNGKYLIILNDGEKWLEWWVSDGTPEGTKMLKEAVGESFDFL